jgi:hypothetical protein
MEEKQLNEDILYKIIFKEEVLFYLCNQVSIGMWYIILKHPNTDSQYISSDGAKQILERLAWIRIV